jgi:A/G-specific adenine glycosylase
MKAWEGLGYYRRARNLHRAAKDLTQNGNGVPKSAEKLKQLPGIGGYTASAIASIAYGEVAAAIDGNVARVIARLFAINQDVRASAGQARVANLARELICPSRPGDFNQAWMDLGSMICTPQAPSCPICPLRDECAAYVTGMADQLPILAKKRSPKPVSLIAALFVHRGKVLVVRDNNAGWWSGLWAFPSIERTSRRPLRPELDNLAGRHGLSIRATPERAAAVRHQLTHRTLTFDVCICELAERNMGARVRADMDRKWVTDSQLEKLPVSTAHRKIWASAANQLSA